jgi:hypothetical protein
MITRTTIAALLGYSVFVAALLAFIFLFFMKNPDRFDPFPIIFTTAIVVSVFVLQNKRPEGVGVSLLDASLIGLLLMSPILLGSVALLIDIPAFNYVEPTLLFSCYLNLLLGFLFGYFVGGAYTKKQLGFLDKNNEFSFRRGASAKLEVLAIWGMNVYVMLLCLGVYLDLMAIGFGLIVFAISGAFALFLTRFIQVRAWEGNTGRIVMMTKKRFYTKYKNLPTNY